MVTKRALKASAEDSNHSWQTLGVTVAMLDASRTGTVQHLNDQNSLRPQKGFMVFPAILLLPYSLFNLKGIQSFHLDNNGTKAGKGPPCLSTISCGDGFVALSCVSM